MRIQDWRGEIGGVAWWGRAMAMAVTFGVILGVFGPFGSFLNGNVMLRIVSWTVNLTVGTVIIGTLVPLITRAAMTVGLPRLGGLAIGMIVAAAPAAAFSDVFGHMLWPTQVGLVRPEDWYFQSVMVETFMIAVWVMLSLALQALAPGPVPAVSAPVADPRDPVLCLQMEDHYVRIHRSSGSTLELMPLHEAIKRYGGKGLQVHRSWWVSASAVNGSERDVRNWRLRLSNGLAVPVARNRVVEVRAQG